MENIEEIVKKLPPDLKREVEDFVNSLIEKKVPEMINASGDWPRHYLPSTPRAAMKNVGWIGFWHVRKD